MIPTDSISTQNNGEIALPSAKETALISEEEDSSEVSYRTNSEAKHKIQVECENGNIRIG